MTPSPATLAARLPPLPAPLPDGWVFTEDDDMGHGFDQFDFLFTLVSILRLFLARQGKGCFVGSDQHIGIDPRDRRITVAPDVYILPQPEPPAARGATWFPWEHHNLVPTLAFEFVSQSNRKKDYLVAPDKYAHLGVQELIVFEPWKHQPGLRVQGDVETFRVYRLDEKRQWRQVYSGDGPTRSYVLGLWLHETSEGKLLLTEDRWGKRALLTPEEQLQVEQEAQRLAEERAEREAQRAEREAQRADQAEALVRRTKAEAVLAVLQARGLAVTSAQESQVRGCEDLAELDRWLKAALKASSTAQTLASISSKPSRKRKTLQGVLEGRATAPMSSSDHSPELLRLPPGRALWTLAWPVIALGLLRSGYHLAAAFWAGHLPDAVAAQAALGATAFAFWILMSIAELAGVGVHALVARAEGARERWRVGALVTQGTWVAVLCGVLLSVAAEPLCRGYLDALRFQGSAFEAPRTMGQGYLLALLRGAPLLMLHTMCSAVFRGIGDTRTPMVISTTTLVVNAALDPVLMFGWGGAPELGLAGAGWATIAASGVGLGLYWAALKGRGIRVDLRWPEPERVWQIVRIGAPSTASGIGFCMVYVALGELLARFGPSALAGLGLGHRLEGPAYQISAGFGAAAATLVGQHLGAGEPEAAARAAHRTARWACAAMAPLTVMFVTAPRWLVGLFSPDAEAVARGASYLFLLGLILAPMAMEIVYEGAFAGAGETWIAMGIVVTFTGARIPMAWWLADRMGLTGVWITIMVTCALKGFLLWGAFSWRSRRKNWGSGAHLS